MKQKVNNYNGISFIGVLQIVFIVLKLCKVISWKWIWVLSPAWIYAIFLILLLIIYFIYVKREIRKDKELSKKIAKRIIEEGNYKYIEREEK